MTVTSLDRYMSVALRTSETPVISSYCGSLNNQLPKLL